MIHRHPLNLECPAQYLYLFVGILPMYDGPKVNIAPRIETGKNPYGYFKLQT